MQLKLTTEENNELTSKIEEFIENNSDNKSLQSFSLDEKLIKWKRLAQRVEEGYMLNIDDYTNDLSNRDILERFTVTLSKSLAEKVFEYVNQIDAEFKSATEYTDLSLLDDDDEAFNASLPWWWHRFPKNLVGELKEDIDSLKSRRSED